MGCSAENAQKSSSQAESKTEEVPETELVEEEDTETDLVEEEVDLQTTIDQMTQELRRQTLQAAMPQGAAVLSSTFPAVLLVFPAVEVASMSRINCSARRSLRSVNK